MKTWLTGKKIISSLLVLTSLMTTSCANSNDDYLSSISSPLNTVTQSSVKVNSADIPNISVKFITDLKKENINLNSQEIEQLNKLIKIQPTGEWTPGPENDSKANWKKHFIKHGHEFKPPYKTQEDYLAGAIKASKNQCDDCNSYFDTKYYKDEKMLSVVRWNAKTLDFSVTRDNGQIATYFTNKVKAPRFILIPKQGK